MSNASDFLAGLSGIHDTIGDALAPFGGIVRCETCRGELDVTAERASRYTAHGWPKCHGQTMRWWTQRQIDAGEMPA